MRERHQKIMGDLGLPRPLQHFIAGEFRAEATRTIAVVDPTTHDTIAQIPQATESEIETAVRAAKKAQEEWRNVSPGRRRKTLETFAAALKKREKIFPRAEALDAGMPMSVSKQFSCRAMVRHLEYYGEWADKIDGQVVPAGAPTELINMVMYEPVGVVVGIIPWNTPCLFLGSKTGPALAAGCSVIIKPSELASLPAHFFAEAAAEAGIPPGLFQIVYGDGEVGKRLCTHELVNKIAFTGGTAKGREIMAQASSTLKRVSLELGGKSPHIIFEDADTSRATMMAAFGMFSLSGQGCAAGTRLFLHESLADPFVEGLVSFVKSMKLGDPLEGETMLGPLITEAHLKRVDGYVQEAKANGAKILCGGKRSTVGDGNFYEPTILTHVDPQSRIAQEEIFGPVLCVFSFATEEELLAKANNTIYGLAAGVWTKDVSRALRVAAKLQAGTVWVNQYGNLPIQSPFGGWKQSGYGQDGGRQGIMEYLQPKNILIQI